jgi:hypothetical protein
VTRQGPLGQWVKGEGCYLSILGLPELWSGLDRTAATPMRRGETGDSKTLDISEIGEKDRVISGLVSSQLFEDTGGCIH